MLNTSLISVKMGKKSRKLVPSDTHRHTHRQTGPILYPQSLTREGIKCEVELQVVILSGQGAETFRYHCMKSKATT